MSQFLNKREDIVTEAIDGLIACSGGRLARLDGYPHIRVVVRKDWDKSKVALISGGGSGHEPSHAGLVGEGMLTAAICGDVFASPSVDAVLAGILAVTGPAGCVLIIKNYTGDRLNFGLAAERARALGMTVSTVYVADDVALPHLHQPRGVAGTVLVHKALGALSAAGADLPTIAAAAATLTSTISTIGMSLSTCTLPASGRSDRIPSGTVELGLGIHGEAGAEQMAFAGAKGAVDMMVSKLLPHAVSASAVGAPHAPHVVLINNLGGTSCLEMSCIAHAVATSALAPYITHVVGPTAIMTAIDMHGISLSIVPAVAIPVPPSVAAAVAAAACAQAPSGAMQVPLTSLLAASTAVPAWPGIAELVPVATAGVVPLPDAVRATAERPVAVPRGARGAAARVVDAVCAALGAAEAELNSLDAAQGDGDTGSTFAAAGRAVRDALVAAFGEGEAEGSSEDAAADSGLGGMFDFVSRQLGTVMGGSSGVLLCIFCAAVARTLSGGAQLAAALQGGVVTMMEVGGARVGDRTMLDALYPAVVAFAGGKVVHAGLSALAAKDTTGAFATANERATEALKNHADKPIAAAAAAARAGAEATSVMKLARAGRAAYVGASQLVGHVDPGAEAIARIFESLLKE